MDIVHRDIKPENVLFESNEDGSLVKLIDFGLSRMHGRRENPMSSKVGTPYYMSRGIIRGKYDRSCDIWAVGVVAYIVLCGYPPFNGANDREVHKSTLGGNVEFDKKVWENLSGASVDFVRRLLSTDASKIVAVEEALKHPWIASA